MPFKFVFLNGPPRSGKDTCAKFLQCDPVDAVELKFSRPLKDGLQAIFDYDDAEREDLEEIKEIPNSIFPGLSYREAQISLSEDWMKKTFGPEIFSQILIRSVLTHFYDENQVFAISDSGFESEAEPVIRRFGPENCLLLRITRPGFTFKGDSRSYITLPCKTLPLINDSSVENLRFAVNSLVQAWLKGEI